MDGFCCFFPHSGGSLDSLKSLISLESLENGHFGEADFLSSAGAGRSCALSMTVPNPSPVLDKNSAHLGLEISASTGAGVWRKAPGHFQIPAL